MIHSANPAKASSDTALSPFGSITSTDVSELDRAFATRDASVILDALGANLDWLERSMAADLQRDYPDSLMCESLQICRQLVGLLGGALGCCSDVTATGHPQVLPIQFCLLVNQTMELISQIAGPERVVFTGEPPEDITVKVDPEAMIHVLGVVGDEATRNCACDGQVEVVAKRSGSDAVIAITFERAAMAGRADRGLDASSDSPMLKGAPKTHGDVESLTMSKILLDRGGFLDVEWRPDGGITLYVVVPTDDAELDSRETVGTALAGLVSCNRESA